jgi:hypothetical protein
LFFDLNGTSGMRKGANSGVSVFGLVATVAFSLFLTAEVFAAAQGQKQPAALDYVGIYKLREAQPALTGTGVKIAAVGRSMTYSDGLPMNDYRPFTAHQCLGGKVFAFHDNQDMPAGISFHETAVASILFGGDPNAYLDKLGAFAYEGVAPDASAEFHEFWHFLTGNVFPSRRPDADVLTISLGSPFEDWWTRGIDAMAERYGLPIVAGVGNGLSAHDSVLFPAAGSNVIAVGVIEEIHSNDLMAGLANFWLPQPRSSSCGPTDDNRAKPDIVAPGRCVVADGTTASAFIITPTCSSYATPIVAGTIGLLAQNAKADPNLKDALGEGSACVMKAILLTSARKMPYWHKGAGSQDNHLVPLDYTQGAGQLDAFAADELLRSGRQAAGQVDESGWDWARLPLDGATANTYVLDGSNIAGKTITATLVWNRHYLQTYPFAHDSARDTDLSLELWAIDRNGAHLADYSDSHADNLEHLSFVADANAQYMLLVRLSENGVKDAAAIEKYALTWRVSRTPAKDATWYDLNGDGVVNAADVMKFITDLTMTGSQPTSSVGDLNMDGRIDVLDLIAIIKAIGRP